MLDITSSYGTGATKQRYLPAQIKILLRDFQTRRYVDAPTSVRHENEGTLHHDTIVLATASMAPFLPDVSLDRASDTPTETIPRATRPLATSYLTGSLRAHGMG